MSTTQQRKGAGIKNHKQVSGKKQNEEAPSTNKRGGSRGLPPMTIEINSQIMDLNELNTQLQGSSQTDMKKRDLKRLQKQYQISASVDDETSQPDGGGKNSKQSQSGKNPKSGTSQQKQLNEEINSSLNSATQRRKKSKNEESKFDDFEQPSTAKSAAQQKRLGSSSNKQAGGKESQNKPGKGKKQAAKDFEQESISDTIMDPCNYVEEPEQPKVVNQNPFVSQRIIPFGSPAKQSGQQNSNSKQKS